MAGIPKWALPKIRAMSHRRAALGLWLLMLALCVGILVRTRFRTDMGDFLPRSAPMAQQVLTEQVTSGAASHLTLLAITGAPAPVLAALSEALATRLRRQPAFTDTLNGDPQSFAAEQDFVWRNRYLLSPYVTAGHFSEAALHAALLNDIFLLGSDLGMMLQQSLPGDPTDEALRLTPLLSGGQNPGGPLSQDGVWFSADGARAILLVHTRAAGFDIDAQAQALAAQQSDFAAARAATPGAGPAMLLQSGPGVFATHTRDITRHDVKRLSMLASFGAIALLGFAYRSPLVMLLGMLPVASGALAAIAVVSLVFGFVHGITLGFGVTLIGESLDYAIYLFTQTGRLESGQDTLSRIWPTLRLGMLTSVAGFSAMLFSSFTGFAQLGLFSITGLVVAAGVTRFVLPQLLPAGFYAVGADAISAPLRGIIAHRRLLRRGVILVLLASGAALVLHRGGFWDHDLAGLSPIPAADQKRDDRLRQDLGIPGFRFFAVLQAPDRQMALQQSETLAAVLNQSVAAQQLGGFDVPSSILPSDQTQQARRAALPDAATLALRLQQAQAGLPFRTDSFAPFLKDVAMARTAPLITPDRLPPELALKLDSMLVKNGKDWVVMAPLRDVADPAELARAISAAGLPGAAFVDLNQQSDQLLRRFQREASLLASFGTAGILILLLAGLRPARRVATVAAPLAAAVLITAALLTIGGSRVTIFEVVGFLLIVAVGSNYCLFFERAAPDAQSWRRAIASVMLANLCTVCAYGLMAFSSIPVLHDIGKTVALGTFLSMVCAAILNVPKIAADAA
jgi:predicted exporter